MSFISFSLKSYRTLTENVKCALENKVRDQKKRDQITYNSWIAWKGKKKILTAASSTKRGLSMCAPCMKR